MSTQKYLIGAFLLCFVVAIFYSRITDDYDRSAFATEQTIYRSVANDVVNQYEIAARHGDKMQMYVQAGICAAAFLQAGDEMNYRKWKDREREIGKGLGIPQY